MNDWSPTTTTLGLPGFLHSDMNQREEWKGARRRAAAVFLILLLLLSSGLHLNITPENVNTEMTTSEDFLWLLQRLNSFEGLQNLTINLSMTICRSKLNDLLQHLAFTWENSMFSDKKKKKMDIISHSSKDFNRNSELIYITMIEKKSALSNEQHTHS